METTDPGSRVRSDDWNGYNLLPRYGYRHIPVAHKILNLGMPRLWFIWSRRSSSDGGWELTQGAISPDNLRYYLDEFTFRFNRRASRSRGKLFYGLIEGALLIDRVPAKTLKHNI
ncbi:hypothetical protein ACVBEG_27445 [Pseudomonas sp. GG8]